jgi:hypothetical protein
MVSIAGMKRAAVLAVVLVVALTAALGRVAHAQPRAVGEPPPAATAPPETVVQAREHYQKGLTHFDLKEYADALIEFKNAYRLVQDPPLLFNIAQCHRRLGQNAEALDFYRNYLRRAPHSANRAEVERRIREIERELPVDAKPATGLGSSDRPSTGGKGPAAATAPPAARPTPPTPTTPQATTITTTPVPTVAPRPAPSPPAATATPAAKTPPGPPAARATTPAPLPAAAPAAATTPAPVPGADLRASAETPPPAPAGKPIYKRWWFWAGIGVLAIAGVAAVAAAKRGEIGDCSGIGSCVTLEKGQ